MNTYTLKINSVECQTTLGDLTDVIKNVHWTYEVTNGTESAYIIGVDSLDEPAPESFVAFDSLTTPQVLEWLESKLDIERLQSMLDKRLEEVINPPIVTKRLADQDVSGQQSDNEIQQ